MKKIILLAILCVSCAFGGEVDDLAGKLEVPGLTLPKLETEPGQDKEPDFAGWAGPVSFKDLKTGKQEPVLKTEGFMACSESHLYLAVRSADSDMSGVNMSTVARDGNVWKGDSLEFMLMPGIDPAGAYYQFAVNPGGSLFDAKADQKEWNSKAETFAYKTDKNWTVVLAVPFASLELEEIPALLRVNLHRLRPKRSGIAEFDSAWSPTLSKSNHVPSKFGLVFLKGLGKTIDPAAAAAADDAVKVQILYANEFDEHTESFTGGKTIIRVGGWGKETVLRLTDARQVTFGRMLGKVEGQQMAFAYHCNADQHGVVVQGSTAMSGARPGMATVVGRGLQVAKTTCQDADRQSRADDLGMDAFLFKRPYGH